MSLLFVANVREAVSQLQEPTEAPRFEIMPVAGFRAANSWPGARMIDANLPAGGDPNLPPGMKEAETRSTHWTGAGGGWLIGAQAHLRVTRTFSVVVTGTQSEWSTPSRRFATPADQPQQQTYQVQGGRYRTGSVGLASEFRIKGVAPISLLLAPGLLAESDPADTAALEAFEQPVTHPVFAVGLEGRFPLSLRVARLTARAGLRDHLVFWNEAEYNRRYREYYSSIGSGIRPEVRFDGNSHVMTGYVGVSIGW